MCGIFGIITNIKSNKLINHNASKENISLLILNALNLLKNRGYDSCGIYMSSYDLNNVFLEKFGVDSPHNDEIMTLQNSSNQSDIFEIMENKIKSILNPLVYDFGIGHTRWATHGGKTDSNSHPHLSNDKKIKVVHNGIVSNYADLKNKYLYNYTFNSSTDTEVIANMIQYLKQSNLESTSHYDMENILEQLTEMMEGTWACMILDYDNPNKIFFLKNENPLLIGQNENMTMFTSEPSGFMNKVSKYYLLRDKTFGFVDNNANIKIYGEFKEIDLIMSSQDDIVLPSQYKHWMYKEILEQAHLNVLIDPITHLMRYNQSNVLFNFNYIKPCKYLYIIACGSSYYAGIIASNYFRYTKAFEFVNVFDGGEFTKAHLEAIENPETNLLVLLISQSGETRDLNIATTICREYSTNRKNTLKPNYLLHKNDSINVFPIENTLQSHQNEYDNTNKTNRDNYSNEIKIIGIINVIGSLISRRTIDNIYTNCGRENAVASTKSCTSQILACLLLAIYKSELCEKLNKDLKSKFLNDLNRLEMDITHLIQSQKQIEVIASNILDKKKPSIFLLGKDELHGVALEGALKIKEIAYLHAEGFGVSALKHGPYALIEKDTPIIVIYKERDHFIKSIVEEIKTRGAYVIEISPNVLDSDNSLKLPSNKTFTGLLGVIALQLLSYYLSIKQNINPDMPKNLAKVVTVD